MGIYCCQIIRSNATIQNKGTFVCGVLKPYECIDQIGIFDKSCHIFYQRLEKVLLQRVTYLSQKS